ncbi:MAG TPA: DUF1801 domain-containing protein [Armatimonadota bacterium]|jgi:uncharacterized protein YdhG (YjbR/CyaY superfamily)
MSIIDDYLATVPPAEKAEFQRIRGIVKRLVPSVEEGVSYGMPAYLYNGKPVLSAIANKRFLSIYPFSGKVIDRLKEKLTGFECTSGSVHFTVERPVPEALLEEIIACRLQEIDAPKRKS